MFIIFCESLISLPKNERPWAIRSGCSEKMSNVSESLILLTKNERMSESLIFLSESLTRSFFDKKRAQPWFFVSYLENYSFCKNSHFTSYKWIFPWPTRLHTYSTSIYRWCCMDTSAKKVTKWKVVQCLTNCEIPWPFPSLHPSPPLILYNP